MGCGESKLAVATAEPIKRSKSASLSSSRSSSRRVDNPLTTTIGAAKAVQQKKPVESRGCQTTEHCSEEEVKEKSKCESSQHDGQRGSKNVENNVGEENKKTESGLAEESELKCEKQGKTEGEAFETREQDHVKIEEGEAQIANDQVQATKEEAEVGAMDEAQNESDDEVVEEGAKNAEPTKVEAEPMTAQDGENAKEVESTEAEVATVVVEGTTVAQNTNDEVGDVEEEVGALVEEETEKIALQIEDDQVSKDQVSKDVEKVEPIELVVGTLNEEKTENSEA